MNVLPGHGEDLHQHAFRKSMFSHDAHSLLFARAGQFEMSILVDGDQPVTLHSRHRLRDGGATLAEAFGNPGPHGGDAFFLELIDGAQIHLGGVDEVAHAAPCVLLRWPTEGVAPTVPGWKSLVLRSGR